MSKLTAFISQAALSLRPAHYLVSGSIRIRPWPALLACMLSSPVAAEQSSALTITAASTSLQTGLLERLLDGYAASFGEVEIALNSVGSLQAIEAARSKQADIVVSHHQLEAKGLVESGIAKRIVQLAHSRFAVFGPPDDEFDLASENSIEDVLLKLASEEVDFIVPSPRGGTYAKIEELWSWVGINPDWPGYDYTAVSSQSVFDQAAEFGAYTIAESGLYYRDRHRYMDKLLPLYENDYALRNTYTIILVNRGARLHPEASGLFEFMVSPEGQDLLLEAARSIFNADIVIPAAAHDPTLRHEQENRKLREQTRNLRMFSGLVMLIALLGFITLFSYTRLQRKEQERLKILHENELKQVELNRAQEQNEMKSRFVSNVTHDLKTPIHAIQGYTALVIESLGSNITDKESKYLDTVKLCSQRMSDLIDDILQISVLDQDSQEFDFEDVDLNSLLTSAIAETDILCKEKSVSLQLSPCDTDVEIVADKLRLTQAIINILSNAIRFTPADGRIEVHCQNRAQGDIEITVRDTGPGIPEQDIEHVFDKFFQASNTSREQGTGLGLAICSKIIERHHGDLKASNHPQGGAVLSIRLPVTQPVDPE